MSGADSYLFIAHAPKQSVFFRRPAAAGGSESRALDSEFLSSPPNAAQGPVQPKGNFFVLSRSEQGILGGSPGVWPDSRCGWYMELVAARGHCGALTAKAGGDVGIWRRAQHGLLC